MTQEQWQRLKEIFEAAMSKDAPQRAEHVAVACGTDDELRREVMELLRGHDAASGFLTDETLPLTQYPTFREKQLVANRFRILKFQGRGGMGEVYRAHDERLDEEVGLKTIRAELALNPDARQRFEREIVMARKVSHENVCRVYDVVDHVDPEQPETPIMCLSMEWLEGETLDRLIKREGPLDAEKALPLIRQIVGALDALHERGIVHRDLKPGNIILVPRPGGTLRAVVTDFGIAKPVAAGEQFETQSDLKAGSPYFMAPEQIMEERQSAASDIYSLGLVIDDMVAYRRAFQASSVAALVYQRLWAHPEPLSHRAVGLPAHWEAVLARCLERNPVNRYESASAVLAALEGRVIDGGQAAPPAKPVEQAAGDKAKKKPAQPEGPIRRIVYRGLTAAAAVALLLVLTIAGFALLEPNEVASVVVFRIATLGVEERYQYLAHGLTGDLINRLSRQEGLKVSAYPAPRSEVSREQIKERFLVDGELQKSGKQVRLTMRLTDAVHNQILRSMSYDRILEDPLDLQTEISRELTISIRESLRAEGDMPDGPSIGSGMERFRIKFAELMGRRPATHNRVAYEKYVQGMAIWESRRLNDTLRAIELFKQATYADEDYGQAYAALSDAYRNLIDLKYGSQDQLLAESERWAREAVSRQPRLAEGHASLAAVRQMQWDWESARHEYQKAIELNPTSAAAYWRYAGLRLQFGETEEALKLTRKALELSPYDYPVYQVYGLFLFMAGRYDEAAKELEGALAKKDVLFAHHTLATVYARQAQLASGEERARLFELALNQARTLQAEERARGGSSTLSDLLLALVYSIQGNREASDAQLKELMPRIASDLVSPYQLALIHASRGEQEVSARYLESALRIRDRGLLYAPLNPFLAPMRDTEIFRRIKREMNL